MADHFPLIADASANQIKEIPSGDNLNLSNNGIVGVGTINADTFVKSGGTSSQYLMADGSTTNILNTITDRALLVDEKPNATHGGGSQNNWGGGYGPRHINTIKYNPGNMVSLNGVAPNGQPDPTGFQINQAGDYIIDWSCPFYNVGYVQTALKHVGFGTIVLPVSPSHPGYIWEILDFGTTEWCGNQSQVRSKGSVKVSVAATMTPSVYILQYQCSTATATWGLGLGQSFNSYVNGALPVNYFSEVSVSKIS